MYTKRITKKRSLLLLFSMILTQQIQANFNFGECQGSGTFEQQIHKYQNYEDAAIVGEIYGTMPRIEIDSPDAWDDRLVPTTAMESYLATVVKWFGAT